MVPSCSVYNCESRLIIGNGIYFHRLPFHSPELLQKWLKSLKIDSWTPTKYFNVCSKHFKEDDYQKSESGASLSDLLEDAVPSVFLDSSKHKTSSSKKRKSSNSENTSIKPARRQSNKTSVNRGNSQPVCFVPNCKASKDLPLYNFPIDDMYLLNIWTKRIGLSSLYDMDVYLNLTICRSHFHANCFDKNTMCLKPNAVPSLNLIDYSGPDDCCLVNAICSEENSNQVMAITGDHTWGWLGSTEQFGRDTNPRDFTVIPKSQICDQKYKQSTQAAHCAIYANNDDKIFGIYNARAAVLMQLRYDGYIGFPGGLIDSGEDFVSAVNRELTEELNLDTALHSISQNDHVISHWNEKLNLTLHFYKLQVTKAELIEIEKRALLAHDYGSEVLGTIRVPLYTLGDHYRGFPAFLKNNFIGCSRDQLLTVLSSQNIMSHEEIQVALNAISKK